VRAAGRPAADPACAGCAQLALLRALRRAGVEVQGGLGCDPAAEAPIAPDAGRWAAVTGAGRILRGGATAWLGLVASAGARFAVVADRVGPVRSTSVEDALDRAAAPVIRLDLDDLAGTEARVREALDRPGSVLLALAPCVRGRAAGTPLRVDASRCNRCGACLSLACPALSDGGEAVVVDALACTGCGRCAPLCRSRALGRPTR
jgi:TPP-dependent indolepyruvate ferredoxin oxidoreductase alpha subunit